MSKLYFDTNFKHGGIYECRASSELGTVSHAAMIRIRGPPFIHKMEPITVFAGRSMYVTCPVSGWPISSVSWEKGRNVIFFDSLHLLRY